MSRSARSALLVVDVQRDFCAGGALAVPGAEALVPRVNELLKRAAERNMPVYASRDWHPSDSTHFAGHGGHWPVHCVAEAHGAEFHPDLALPPDAIIVTKGQTANADGYSAFDGTTQTGRFLREDLEGREVGHLVVVGLATDYCVRHSVIDAAQAGFDVTVVTDAIAGVDVSAGDSQRALDDMANAGATLVTTDELVRQLASRECPREDTPLVPGPVDVGKRTRPPTEGQ